MSFLNQNTGEPSHQEANTESQQAAQQFTENQSNQEEQVFLKVGDRVFKSQEEAVRHISSAQEHISKLENDFASATSLVDRQAQLLEKAKNVDDVMEALASKNSSGNAEGTPQLSKDEVIADAIRAFELKQKEQTRAQQMEQNWSTVTSTLSQMYGDKTDEVVQKVAGENGLSIEEAATMAKSHPKVFLKMFDNGTYRSAAKPNQGSVNSLSVNTPARTEHRPLARMSMKERAAEVQRRLQELN